MRPRAALLAALAALLAGQAAPAHAQNGRENFWSKIAYPTGGLPRVVGFPTAGCVLGARALPLDGVGYQVVRVSRHRYYGHPMLINYVEALGRTLNRAGLPPVYVGDLSQPRGGPMPSGHRSHQTGIDVDIWFNLAPKPHRPPAAREDIDIHFLVTSDQKRIDPARWTDRHATLIRLAAEPREVDRVFVHYVIKKQLCETTQGARGWLHKVRPWFGHMDHLHVRLNCPGDSAECVRQDPIPAGDGCDATLASWFAPRPPPKKPDKPPEPKPPRPVLPAACQAIAAD